MDCEQCGQPMPLKRETCVDCGASADPSGVGEPTGLVSELKEALAASEALVSRLRRFIPPVIVEGVLFDQDRLRGERRDITVLFVDAVDFTRLSVSLDAESVFDLINDLLSRLVACIHRYGGLVDKFTGDGLMAVFGAPIAQENDVELAVRAALDMQEAARDFAPIARAQLGAPIQIRIGINHGPAIAGLLGTPEQSAYTVIGETVNVAARLESAAQPGHVLVSTAVHARSRPFFDFAPLQYLSIKGVDQPIPAYEVLTRRAAPASARGIPGMSDIYLGRDAELGRLHRILEGFEHDTRGRFISVIGEAGMGKSRLVSEWLHGVDDSTLTVWHGRGLPYAQGTGYGIFRSLLRDALKTYTDEQGWESRVSDSFKPLIRRLLGLPTAAEDELRWEHLPPERLNQLTTLAIREWLLHEAQQCRLVLIFDDYHWADDLSRDALQSLLSLVDDAPILFCVMTRPRPEINLNLAALSEDLCDTFEIPPLSASESHALLSSFVDITKFPPSAVETILLRAEGNPFYIEEFVRMLIEREVLQLQDDKWAAASSLALETLDFPTSLRGLMLARIDRLPEDLRHLLQGAAVIGLQFDAALLQTVERRTGRSESTIAMIERLRQLDLLEQRAQMGPGVYAFRHILTQETIYGSILRSERPELHRIVAESIEELYGQELDPYIEVLALHYDRARLREKALIYTLQSGIRAQGRFANREAIEYYSRALQLSQHIDQAESERWQAAVGLGDVQQHIGEYEEAIAFYNAALEERQQAPALAQAEVMLKLGRTWDKHGNLENARSWLRSAAEKISLSKKSNPGVEAEIYSALGWFTFRDGDLSVAQALLEQATGLVDQTANYDVLSSILNRLGAVYFSQGDLEKATTVVQRSLDIRERLGDLLGVARSSNNLGILKHDRGDWQGALQTHQRTLEAMHTIGDREGIAMAHTNIGNVYIDLRDWEQAEMNLRRSYEIAQQIANPYEKAQANTNLARLYMHQNKPEQAEPYLDTALNIYAQLGVSANPNMIDTYWLRGMVHLEKGELAQAGEWCLRHYALLREGTGEEEGESSEWGRYYQFAGRLALSGGETQTALERLTHAKSVFQENRSPAEVGRTAYWLAQAYLCADQVSKARAELEEACEVYTELGADAELARVEQLLTGLSKALA